MVKTHLRLITAAMAACILPFGAALPAFAAPDAIAIEQAQVEAPALNAWVIAEGGDLSAEDISARLDNDVLGLKSLNRYDHGADATEFFFIIDCSTSVTPAHIAAIKEIMTDFTANLAPQDSISLITFGVDVDVVLNRESDADVILAAIAELNANQRGTLFYEALAKAIELSANANYALERKIAFVFTDADDYASGSHTKEEIDKLVENTNLAFYAMGHDNGSREGLDSLGAFARQSGGAIRIVRPQTMSAAFDELWGIIDGAWLLELDMASNIIAAPSANLSINLASSGVSATRTIALRFWQPDNIAPSISGIRQLSGESIEISFSEAVLGADQASSYTIRDNGANVVAISAAAYDEATFAAVLTLAALPPSGTLSVDFPGISDISMEANKVAGAVDLDFVGVDPTPEPKPTPEPEPVPEPAQTPIAAWIFICIIAAGIITAVAVGIVKKSMKKPEETLTAAEQNMAHARKTYGQNAQGANNPQLHFAAAPGTPAKKIRLNVADASGKAHVVELSLGKTLFFGRSDICDVFFDDTAMSRQHFAIGEEAGILTISNLSSSVGTLLNGVTIGNPRPLVAGDVIGAGRQTITFIGYVNA